MDVLLPIFYFDQQMIHGRSYFEKKSDYDTNQCNGKFADPGSHRYSNTICDFSQCLEASRRSGFTVSDNSSSENQVISGVEKIILNMGEQIQILIKRQHHTVCITHKWQIRRSWIAPRALLQKYHGRFFAVFRSRKSRIHRLG